MGKKHKAIVPLLSDHPYQYGFGGDLWESSILGGGDGMNPVGTIGEMGSGLVNTIDGIDGKTSKAGSIGSNALKFGAMGASIGGPWGAAIGGVLGAGIGLFTKRSEDREKRRQEREAKALQAKNLRAMNERNSSAVLAQYPTQGIQTPGFYRRGGEVKPQYKVEDGEVLFASEANPPVTNGFGTAKKIAPSTYKFEGVSHNHPSGGIGVKGGSQPYVDQYGQPHQTGFVLSNKLTTNSRKYFKNI